MTAGVNPHPALDIDIAAIAEKKGVMLYVSELDTDPPETDGDGGDAPIYQPNQRPNIQSGRVEDTLDYVDGVENPNAAPSAERPKIDIPVQSDTEVYITETENRDRRRYRSHPRTSRDYNKRTGNHHQGSQKRRQRRRRPPQKAPETTTKAPETTTTKEPETTTQTPPETESKQEETTGSADENEDPS